MAKKSKPLTQGVKPPGTIPYRIKGVWRCTAVDLENDIFTFQDDKGNEFLRKWEQIPLTDSIEIPLPNEDLKIF